MGKTIVLMELARLELETARIMSELDFESLDKQAESLVRRAESEHASRAREFKLEFNRRNGAGASKDSASSEPCNLNCRPCSHTEPLMTAELAEERLTKLHEMAKDILPSQFVREMAQEQKVLWQAFSELRRSCTLKMDIVA